MADLTSMVQAERKSLADYLETLAPEQWTMPSWCAKWNVQELVRGPAMSLILAMVGRSHALGDCTGPGIDVVRGR